MNSLRRFAALGLLIFLSACGAGPRLSEQPKQPVDLSGSWLMDVERSDDVEAVVSAAFSEARRGNDDKKNKRDARLDPNRRPPPRDGMNRSEPDGGADSGDSMAMMRPDELIFADRRMVIEQSPYLVEVTSKRAGYRRYKIGAPVSRTGPGGTFRINSGWSGNDFYAVSVSRQGLEIIERYSLSPDGRQLTREMTLDAKFLDDEVVVTQVYYPES